MRHGFGREVRPDGGEYTGEWREDQREGSGILRMPNGAFHDGHWNHNFPVGQGTRVSSEGVEFVGVWDGEFVANGHVALRAGQQYDGELYDSKRKDGRSGIPRLARTRVRAKVASTRRCYSVRRIGSS